MVAQIVEHLAEDQGVGGAIPSHTTRFGRLAELAECTRLESERRAMNPSVSSSLTPSARFLMARWMTVSE